MTGANFFDSMREAARSLLRAKLRTFIGLTGIAIGIASVIAMISSGKIAAAEARKQFEALGTDIVTVEAEGYEGVNIEDALRLDTLPGVALAAPIIEANGGSFIHAGELVGNGRLKGVTEAFAKVNKLEVQQGRFLSDFDHDSQWCVIGASIADKMRRAGTLRLLGAEIEVEERFYRVVGVLERTEDNFALSYNPNANESLFTHIRVAWRLENGTAKTIIARSAKGVHHKSAEQSIRTWFAARAPDLRLNVQSAEQLIAQMEAQLGNMTMLLGAVGSISLLVGGIGVMNIMLMSVSERKKEIGIRRAIGASRSNIQQQFLLEAVILTLIGGIFGVCAGAGVTWFICEYYTKWGFFISPLSVVIGLGVSSTVGLFFGFQPAYQASRLDPIIALQSGQ